VGTPLDSSASRHGPHVLPSASKRRPHRLAPKSTAGGIVDRVGAILRLRNHIADLKRGAPALSGGYVRSTGARFAASIMHASIVGGGWDGMGIFRWAARRDEKL
jgi:hypothetical protein